MQLYKFVLIYNTFVTVNSLSFKVTSQIYIDVKHHKKPLGRITFGLFGEAAPKAVANFRHLCLRGINGTSYVGSQFHRVINRFLIQGGDIINADGTGSTSIYGAFFDDDPRGLEIKHNRPGYLGMANRGANTNGCQFYVTTVSASWLDGKHTIFGKVIEGMDTVYAIEDVKTDRDDFPLEPVKITNCGEIPIKPYDFYPDDYNIWGWMKAAGLPVTSSFLVLLIFHYFFRQLNMYC